MADADLPVRGTDDRDFWDRSEFRENVVRAIKGGYLGKASAFRHAPGNREALADDILAARENLYGYGSTPPSEVAEVYGWGSRQHQQQELNARQRRESQRVVSDPYSLPWDDPAWYRGIASRRRINIAIPDDPDIGLMSDAERLDDHPKTVAWSHERSAVQGKPLIRVDPAKITGLTMREVEDFIAHEMAHTAMQRPAGHGPVFSDYLDARNIGMSGDDTSEAELIDSRASLINREPRDGPGGGRVKVHIGEVAPAPQSDSGNVHNRHERWLTATYWLISEPGDSEPPDAKSHELVSLRREQMYLVPRSAIMRYWPEDYPNNRPARYELGTVREDGTVSWDCVAYSKPSEESLFDYGFRGWCPPKLADAEVLNLPREERDWLMEWAEEIPDKPAPAWLVETYKRTAGDRALLTREKLQLLKWAQQTGESDLGSLNQRYDAERSRIIAERPATEVKYLSNLRTAQLVAPWRAQLTGGGVDPFRVVTYGEPHPAQSPTPYESPDYDYGTTAVGAIQLQHNPATDYRGIELAGDTGNAPTGDLTRIQLQTRPVDYQGINYSAGQGPAPAKEDCDREAGGTPKPKRPSGRRRPAKEGRKYVRPRVEVRLERR